MTLKKIISLELDELCKTSKKMLPVGHRALWDTKYPFKEINCFQVRIKDEQRISKNW